MRLETIAEWKERTKLTPKVIPVKVKRKYKPRTKRAATVALIEGVLSDQTNTDKNRSYVEIRKSIRRAYAATAS